MTRGYFRINKVGTDPAQRDGPRSFLLFAFALIQSVACATTPRIHESGHELTLFAESPDIVTPIGMAIDDRDRIFIVESHTHSAPSSYDGPKSDRIKMFTDENGDGKADRIEIFAEGLNEALNLAFAKDGTLYVICSHELVALPDRNNDGKCDGPETILTLETESTNPHGCWLGITFDNAGKMYLTRGNVGSAYHRIVGKDGSVVEGYGDGGDIVRANPDGTQLATWATGFWNPFDLKFDHRGKLMLLDNDPDARGPNRLLQVVQGGDYGYKALFGGSGRHPFQGWNGSLPGTLPYLSGTGEAPSGLIDVSSNNSYSYLATIWNENAIERHQVEGDTVRKTIFMSGDKEFRPVALAGDSKGNLYITDWMLVDYPNHGKGRIWRVSNIPLPEPSITAPSRPKPTRATVAEFFKDADLFVRHKAEMWLSHPSHSQLAADLSANEHPSVRLGATLAMRRSGRADASERIRAALKDPDLSVRRIALMWAGESLDLGLRQALDTALTAGELDKTVFEAYLAAVEMLDPDFIKSYRSRSESRSYRIPRKLDPNWLAALARKPSLPTHVRALAIERLEVDSVFDLLSNSDSAIRLAAMHKASQVNQAQARDAFLTIALDQSEAPPLRAEALFGLSRQTLDDPAALIQLMDHPNATIAIEATRLLRLHIGNQRVRKAFAERYENWSSNPNKATQAELAEFALYGIDRNRAFANSRPQDLDTWKRTLASGGDIQRGSRVFRSQQTLCSTCHSADGLGSEFGPNLSGIAQSLSREGIIHAILQPSDSFSPDFQAWNIYTNDGKSHQGVQIDHQSRGDILLYTLDARENVRFKAAEIKDYEAAPYSLMPPGLENTMTISEFRDLIAYLASMQ